ncbi:hypothetical protein PsYK624_057890 [Phanerochaete sordida]|uniref:F-box domain-containing protein n=1 Tax=Phanerochaete sordida TaxID=48140 RepID=A0A9P3LCW1_9APHY|nr:hypothetical protein PsYK624_057890 [Phanerochaete sordida]
MPSQISRGGIASLPSEILEKIIYLLLTEARHIQEYTADYRLIKTGRPYSRALLHITHVARFWRNCAQGSQRLWTNIWPCGQHPEYIDEALARSGTAGRLEVHIADCQRLDLSLIKRGVHHFVALLADYSDRITILEIHGSVDRLLTGHAALASVDTPALRELYIRDDAETSLSLWSALRCPSLDTLVVSRAARSDTWRTIQMNFCPPTLRMLGLGDRIPPMRPVFAEPVPSANDVLALLRGLPQLESLGLSIAESRIAKGTMEVTLPNLRRLQFAMDNHTHQDLLAHIIVQSTTHITQLDTGIHYRLDAGSLEYVTPMPRADGLFQWCCALAQPRVLVMAFNTDGTAELTGAMVACASKIPTGSPTTSLHLESEHDLRQCSEQHPLQNVRELQLVDAYRRDDGPLSDGLDYFFGRFANVRELWLGGDTGPDSGFVPEDLGRLLEQFPRLHVLCLCRSFCLRHRAVKKSQLEDVHIALRFKHALATLLSRRPSDQGDGPIEIFWLGVGIGLTTW